MDDMKKVLLNFILEFKTQIRSIKKDGLKKQVPNMLTFSRAISPIIIIPTIILGRLDVAVVELIVFEITDFLDGRLARKYNCVSNFGVKLDAVCDKIFALGIMIPAIIKIPALFINLLLELGIGYVNIISESKNNHPKSNIIGKIKTAFLSITLVLVYIPGKLNKYVLISASFTLLLQLFALIKYRIDDINKDKKKK